MARLTRCTGAEEKKPLSAPQLAATILFDTDALTVIVQPTSPGAGVSRPGMTVTVCSATPLV